MAAARVDKAWKDKGLSGYSTEAILGTLGHYGVSLDEAAFRDAAKDKSPLELANTWREKWKGTGQFVSYPYAAANELITRFFPERPTPMKVATVLMELIAHGLRTLDGKEADLAGPFGAWDALVPNLPAKGEPRDAFLRELVGFIEAWAKPFNDLPEKLAKAGRKDDALRFARVHEVLFTDREGCMTALVRAASGEREEAVKDLAGWAADGARDAYARYSALDALYQLEALEAVKQHGLAVFDAAAADKKWGLADSIAHLLAHVAQRPGTDGAWIREVQTRLDKAHRHGGGHH